MSDMPFKNIYGLLASQLPEDDRTAIETPDGRMWSYHGLDKETARLSSVLHGLGLQPGDRLASQVDKSPEALLLYLTCARMGVIYVPLNIAYLQDELAFLLSDAQPALVICTPEALDVTRRLARKHGVPHVLTLAGSGEGTLMSRSAQLPADTGMAECSADDTAAIVYTSGTTGRPKGAMITHGNLVSNGLALANAWGFTSSDVLLHALPIFHVHGLFVACHCALLSAARMYFLPKFDTESVIDYLPKSTVFMGVPTYYTRLLAVSDFDEGTCRSMRLFVSGSAPLQKNTFHAFKERTGHTILERYGMTETGMNTSNPLAGPRRPNTVGPPLPGVELRIVDDSGKAVRGGNVGSIQVKGPNVFKGYWGMPERTTEEFTKDGWFKTGDLGKLDHDGYVTIVGRSKDLIITGGYNVYPKEVETVIDTLRGVRESAVIGLRDPDFGERVAAIVVADTNVEEISADTIIASVKRSLANYKVPKDVFFTDELPRNAMGKVQKNVLRDRYARRAL